MQNSDKQKRKQRIYTQKTENKTKTDCQLKNRAKKTKQTSKHGEKKERKNRKAKVNKSV